MKRLLLATAILLTGACDSASLTLPADGEAVPIRGWAGEEQVFRINTTFISRERLVISDAATWAATWPKLQSSGSVPEIDFSANVVIVATMGGKATGGFRIALDTAVMKDSMLWIEVLETSPGSNCATTQALTRPAVVGVLPVPVSTATFVERTSVHSCE